MGLFQRFFYGRWQASPSHRSDSLKTAQARGQWGESAGGHQRAASTTCFHFCPTPHSLSHRTALFLPLGKKKKKTVLCLSSFPFSQERCICDSDAGTLKSLTYQVLLESSGPGSPFPRPVSTCRPRLIFLEWILNIGRKVLRTLHQ